MYIQENYSLKGLVDVTIYYDSTEHKIIEDKKQVGCLVFEVDEYIALDTLNGIEEVYEYKGKVLEFIKEKKEKFSTQVYNMLNKI